MKKNHLLLAMLLWLFAPVKAAVITAEQNGSWSSATTWDLNRTPADHDIVVIPIGKSVNLINTPYSQSNVIARPTLQVMIFGTLDFSNPGNDKLYLDNNSSIQIYAGGQIKTSNSSTEIIAIHNGLSDNVVWNGLPATLSQVGFATAYSNGFSVGVLPVRFSAFSLVCKGGAVQLQWSTAQEQNAKQFDIEKSKDGNSWQIAGSVRAAGTTTTESQYAFTDPAPFSLYRIVQYDFDGRTTISPIRNAACTAGSSIRVQPNLVRDQALIHIAAQQTASARFRLYNQAGMVVQSFESRLTAGNNSVELSMSHLPDGTYTLHTQLGNQLTATRLVKLK